MYFTKQFSRTLVLITMCGFFIGCAGEDSLEQPGDFEIYTELVDVPNPESVDEPMRGRVFAPSTDGGSSIAGEDLGVVIFTPGFGADYSWYREYAEHFASHGYLTLMMSFSGAGFDLEADHPYQARQISYAIDFLSAEYADVVSAENIAAGGHSFGAKIAFYAAVLDSRINVVMALDPSNAGGAPCFISAETCANFPVAPNPARNAPGIIADLEVASFIMRAEPDPLANPDEEFNARYFFYGYDGEGQFAVNSPALYYDMGEITHNSWLPNLFRKVPTIAKRTMLAFLKQYFDQRNMDRYLTGSVIRADINAGDVVAIDHR